MFTEQNNQEASKEDEKVVTIDLEDHCHSNRPHPQHDPGVIIYYRIRINETRFDVKNSHMHGHEILALVEQDPEHFILQQRIGHKGEFRLVNVGPHENVDFKVEGIERFITHKKPKIYHFFIGPKEYTTEHQSLTVRQILADFAKVDPNTKTLAMKTEGGFHEYKNLDEVIPLTNCPHFVVFDNCPTNVS